LPALKEEGLKSVVASISVANRIAGAEGLARDPKEIRSQNAESNCSSGLAQNAFPARRTKSGSPWDFGLHSGFMSSELGIQD
jgi:hypothetical protein